MQLINRSTVTGKREAALKIEDLCMPDNDKLTALDLGPQADLEPDMQAYFAKCVEKLGFVPNVLRAYAFDNAKLRAFMLMADDLMLGDSGLSKLEREMIAVAVSAVNHCHYCLTSHGAAVRQRASDPEMGELMVQNYRAAALPPKQKAMLDFAVRLTEEPDKVDESDRKELRQVGFSRSGYLGYRRGCCLLQHVEPAGRRHRHETQPRVSLHGARADRRRCRCRQQAAPRSPRLSLGRCSVRGAE